MGRMRSSILLRSDPRSGGREQGQHDRKDQAHDVSSSAALLGSPCTDTIAYLMDLTEAALRAIAAMHPVCSRCAQ
jgi:hypothetical protein